MPPMQMGEKDVEGFEKVGNMRRTTKCNPNPEGQSKTQIANRFEALSKTIKEGEGSGEREKCSYLLQLTFSHINRRITTVRLKYNKFYN